MLGAGPPSESLEQGLAAAERRVQQAVADPASRPPGEAGAGAAASGEVSQPGLPLASTGSPSATTEQLSSGGQSSGHEGEDEPGGDTGRGPEFQPAAAASSGKLVVRSREQFMRVWKRFMLSRNLDASPPLFHRAAMDVFKLFRAVYKQGGHDEVVRQKGWARIGRMFNPPSSMTDLSFQTKKIYATKLLEFEKAYRAGEVAAEIALEGPAASPEAGAKPAAAKKKRPTPKPEPARPTPPASAAALPAWDVSEGRQTRGQQRLQEEAETEAAAAAATVAAAAVAAVTAGERPQQAEQAHVGALMPVPMQVDQQQLRQEQGLTPPGLAGEAAPPVASPQPAPLPRPPSRARSHSRASAGARPARPAGSARAASSSKAARGAAAAAEMAQQAGAAAVMEVEQMPPALPALMPSLSMPSTAAPEASQQTVGAGAAEAAVAEPPVRPPSRQRPPRAPRAARLRTTQPEGAESGGAMVGRRIGIWWDGDALFYYGTVIGYDSLTQLHTVQYDDGQEEELALAYEHWVFADGRQQGRPAPGPLALMGSWDLGPAEEGPGGPQGQPAKRARTEELLGSTAGGVATGLQAALFGQQPAGSAAAQPVPLLASPAQPAAGASGSLLPVAGPPTSQATMQQNLPGGFALNLLAPGVPLPPPSPAAPLPPPKLVASGRNYRVFTASLPPAGFELFMLLPGLSIDEVSVRCWSSGLVLIKADPRPRRQPSSAAAELAAGIQLPSCVETRSAQAQFTAVGQLYVRINTQE
ncbi:hypothetical protein ABPG75_007743 [Micractinium tetrahymenae]